jgi:hypothetical protein
VISRISVRPIVLCKVVLTMAARGRPEVGAARIGATMIRVVLQAMGVLMASAQTRVAIAIGILGTYKV